MNKGCPVVSCVREVHNDRLVIFPGIPGQVAGCVVGLNVVPVEMAAGDGVFVPLIDVRAAADKIACEVKYFRPIHFRVVVRNAFGFPIIPFSSDDAFGFPIIPFSSDDLTLGEPKSIWTVRCMDTILTPVQFAVYDAKEDWPEDRWDLI